MMTGSYHERCEMTGQKSEIILDEFLARGDLIGATIETCENAVGRLSCDTEGVIVDVQVSDRDFSLIVEGVIPARRFEFGGRSDLAHVYECEDGSIELSIRYLGTARIAFTS